MIILSCSMDVTKIDKSKLIQGKNGAMYFNFDVIVKDEKDQYGKDASVSVSQNKEEREAKAKKVYIGNGKVVWKSDDTLKVPPMKQSNISNDLPF